MDFFGLEWISPRLQEWKDRDLCWNICWWAYCWWFRNPAITSWYGEYSNISSFTRFHTCQSVQDFFHQEYESSFCCFMLKWNFPKHDLVFLCCLRPNGSVLLSWSPPQGHIISVSLPPIPLTISLLACNLNLKRVEFGFKRNPGMTWSKVTI